MGFFQSLKDDLSEAVDGILGEEAETDDLEAVSEEKEKASENPADTDDTDPLDGTEITLESMLEELEQLQAEDDPGSGNDEEYTPATPEEIAEFESADDGEEASAADEMTSDEDFPDMADLDKLMADIAAMEEQDHPDEEDSSKDPEKEVISEETPDDGGSEEKASEEASADLSVDKTPEKKEKELIGTADNGNDTESEDKQEDVSGETAPDETEEAEKKDITEGEQLSIIDMMENVSEDGGVVKQAEAMAEAAVIADIEEAEAAAAAKINAAGEKEATAEEVAAFEVDTKAGKRPKKKASGTDKKGAAEEKPVSDETAVFAEGMSIEGDVESDGSLELYGRIDGNIDIAGKLKVSGIINGNTSAGEIYADGAEINGDVSCSGSVKIGQSTIIIGNVSGSSAVIAGAIKGDIDVHGPVILDSVAIVMGDIRSQSLQISSGAAVEGMCSQVYSPITPSDFFEGFTGEEKPKGGSKKKKGA